MKHRIKGRKFSRTSSHRGAMFSNMAQSLLQHERIKTTLPKAKDLRPYVEKIITIAKEDSLSNRRRVAAIFGGNQDLVNKLFSDIGPRVAKRNGGYTRIMHFGFRTGDKAPMAIIELVDRKEVVADGAEGKKPAAKKAKTGAKATEKKTEAKKAEKAEKSEKTEKKAAKK